KSSRLQLICIKIKDKELKSTVYTRYLTMIASCGTSKQKTVNYSSWDTYITHNQMYWYIQRPGETMRLIVYTALGGVPDYGGAPENKYSATKAKAENGALTVNDLQQNDTAVYFCAVSKHSDVRSRRSCTKTAQQLI
uniref:Immunoglobulin V-set domain-containing protein n=1 Tax=Oreochromis aureus TaxID=47969 RepID=A0AAZ1XUD6_OREAU